MRVLFDNGTPRGVATGLTGHSVEEARSRGWDMLKNGELLDAAEAAGFDVIVTTDRNIRHQQNLAGRRLAIVILSKARWKLIKLKLATIESAVSGATPGSFVEIEV
jgi:predicted nuclease of predicted toxin-antitoxin system